MDVVEKHPLTFDDPAERPLRDVVVILDEHPVAIRDCLLLNRVDVGDLREPRAEGKRRQQVVHPVDGVLAQHVLLELRDRSAVRAELQRAVSIEHRLAHLVLREFEAQRREITRLAQAP